MMCSIFTPHGSFILDFLAALCGIGLVALAAVTFTAVMFSLVYLTRAWTLPAMKAALSWLDDPLNERKASYGRPDLHG